jgi:enterochelin esterase-like enzyme
MKKSFVLLLSLFLSHLAFAQEALFNAADLTSPEINADKTVTFRFFAPKADSVFVTGDFLPTMKIKSRFGLMDVPKPTLMQKDAKGVWTFTSAALAPELYSYSFTVDGLRSIDPNNPFLNRDVASVTNIFIVGGPQADYYKVNDIAHGSVTRRWYDSPGLGIDRRVTIYTPPGYESSKTNYPVLYLLHGAGGDEEAWIALGRTAQIMDNLIAQGKAKPMIVVMPNGNVSQDAAPGEGNTGFYKPQFMAPRTMEGSYEGAFMDIVKFVEQNYRVNAKKESRAIAGLSMGGFHSMHISRFYPNTFDYVGLFSAAIMPREDATAKVYSNIDQTLEVQKENGTKLYWIAIGKTDFLYQANVDFRKKLDGMGMKYEYVESEGGHIWRNWRVYLSQFVPKLFN